MAQHNYTYATHVRKIDNVRSNVVRTFAVVVDVDATSQTPSKLMLSWTLMLR